MTAQDDPETPADVASPPCFLHEVDPAYAGLDASPAPGVTLHGIKACDTMKKARAWLDGQGIAYTFHDYKTQGVTAAMLGRWCAALGWEKVLNRAGTTFRKLPDEAKRDLDQDKAIALMVAQPSMIKRPVLEMPGAIEVGFKPDRYAALFGK